MWVMILLMLCLVFIVVATTKLNLHPFLALLLAAIAYGAGSMVVSRVNDSCFWVVTGLSGMNVEQGYKLQTLGTLVEGLAAAVVLWIISAVVL